MPTYTFKLLDDGGGVTDDIGLRLPDTKAAYGYARDVAFELMDHREAATRSWRLDVYENGAKKLFGILFATIDETLNHLKPDNVSWLRSPLCVGACSTTPVMRHGSRAANLRRLLPVREVNSTSWLIVERKQFAINFANQRVNRRGRDMRYKKFDRRNET
jgi:hypothetical protein